MVIFLAIMTVSIEQEVFQSLLFCIMDLLAFTVLYNIFYLLKNA